MMQQTLFVIASLITLSACQHDTSPTQQSSIITPSVPLHSTRLPAEQERDRYRHPAETLMFFDVEPDHVVVELWPGSGWYTAVLAPYLKEQGLLIAAHFPSDSEVPFFQQSLHTFTKRFLLDPNLYGKIRLTELMPPDNLDIALQGEADRVLTFRNVHNWMRNNSEQSVFDAAYRTLKSGGVLGVVEHRAPPSFTYDKMVETGYVSEAYVTQLAINAGFVPTGHSEVNANSQDTRDHPHGVWSLPPTLRGGDDMKEKYLAIGESDRMTLKFRKP